MTFATPASDACDQLTAKLVVLQQEMDEEATSRPGQLVSNRVGERSTTEVTGLSPRSRTLDDRIAYLVAQVCTSNVYLVFELMVVCMLNHIETLRDDV